MAIKQRINNKFVTIKSLYYIINGERKIINSLFQYKDGKMIPLFKIESDEGNFYTKEGMLFITADALIFNVKS